MAEKDLTVRDLGRIAFPDAHQLQLDLVAKRRAGACPDTLLLCEHEPVVTLGRATGHKWRREGTLATVASSVDPVDGAMGPGVGGVPVHRIERGGEATYHGPGQLVAYPILDLRERGRDIHAYLRALEEVVLRTVADFGIVGERREGLTGVWVRDAKIAAIGIAIRRWVAFHGLALNVHCDLGVFGRIIPCGIRDCRITTMAQELGACVPLEAVSDSLTDRFGDVFSVPLKLRRASVV